MDTTDHKGSHRVLGWHDLPDGAPIADMILPFVFLAATTLPVYQHMDGRWVELCLTNLVLTLGHATVPGLDWIFAPSVVSIVVSRC